MLNQVKLYSYVITRDFGFAPNPFGEFCTLATCKPGIRKSAKVDDWVIGTGSAARGLNMGNKLIYAMKVGETISLDLYWDDRRFQYKKPVMNGSKKQKYGDNIYCYDGSKQKFVQVDSHHSEGDGSTNDINYARDISGQNVLISSHFWYFGEKAPEIPKAFISLIRGGIGYKINHDLEIIKKFISWLSMKYTNGLIGLPLLFRNSFIRYNGK